MIQNSVNRILRWANSPFRSNGDEKDAGAAMVELALVLVLLVMLLVGTVSAAMAFGRGNSIQNAAREASRFGATLPDGGSTAWLDAVRDVARSAASGDLDAGVSGALICVAFVDDSNDQRLVDDGSGSPVYSATDCYTEFTGSSDDRPMGEERVQVVVQRDTDFQAIVFSTDITLSAEAVARYER